MIKDMRLLDRDTIELMQNKNLAHRLEMLIYETGKELTSLERAALAVMILRRKGK